MEENHYIYTLIRHIRDVLDVTDPKDFTEANLKTLANALGVLENKRNEFTRDDLMDVCMKILESGLTWLPLTDKAARDVKAAEKKDESKS